MQVVIPTDKKKLQRQIDALKYLIKSDNEKDREIHERALKELQSALKINKEEAV